MTPAEHARNSALSLEAKKDALSQRQSGDWKVSFTVQGIDMDARLTQAPMGTRYAMVLVEIGDNEQPITLASKEVRSNSEQLSGQNNAQPRSTPRAGAKRDWRELPPAQQAGIRCDEPTFRAFLGEVKRYGHCDEKDAAIVVRDICGVNSRVELGTKQAARVIWHQLDAEYQAWLAKERVGA
jgi:hypothetical protein